MVEPTIERTGQGAYRPRVDQKNDPNDRRWSTAKDPSGPLWATVKSLRHRQTWRRQADELALRLYSDMRYVGYRSQSGSYQLADVLDTRLGNNLVRSIERVLNSKIARRRSRPFIVTNGGSWKQRNTAENLEKWLIGKLRDLKADEELFPMFRLHALTFGTGCLRSYGDPDEGAKLEVIPTNEIVVDDSEARYGTPRNLYFIRVVDAGVLRARYPDKVQIINEAVGRGQQLDSDWSQGVGAWDTEPTSDLVVVIEAYHLPSGKDTRDGRYVVSTNAGCLYDVEWKRDHFPCAWMRRELRPQGFWGIGVPEDIAGAQIELQRTVLARQEMLDMLATPYWLVERGMKIVRSHISNLIGRVMEWTSTGSGHKPELVAPQAVPAELWQHEATLKSSAFESQGVSQLTAQMLKPLGLNSGKALRAYTELESELLADLMNNYESGLLQACMLLIEEQMELAKAARDADDDSDLAERLKKQKVTYVGSGEIEKISWSDVGLQDDLEDYTLEILPASAMATTLSARIEDVMDLQGLGAVQEPDEIWDYLDMPDKRRMRRKHLSHKHLLQKVIEFRIIDRGEEIIPEPTWDLELAIKLALNSINELELYEDAPADRLELLRIFVEHCRLILEAAMAPPVDPTAAMAAEQPTDEFGNPIAPIDPALDPALAGADADLLGGAPADLAGAGGIPLDPTAGAF